MPKRFALRAIDELLLTNLQPAYETLKQSHGEAYKETRW